MTDEFSTPSEAPSAGGYFNADESVGTLLLIEVKEYRTDFDNPFDTNGEKPTRDGVEVVVTYLDGDRAGETSDVSQLHAGSLVKVLKGSVGGAMVLGRLERGASQKRGFKPPYILSDPTDTDRETARAYLAAQRADAPF